MDGDFCRWCGVTCPPWRIARQGCWLSPDGRHERGTWHSEWVREQQRESAGFMTAWQSQRDICTVTLHEGSWR